MNECIVCGSLRSEELIRNGLPMLKCVECHLVWRKEFDVETSHYENGDVKLEKENLDRRVRNVKNRINLIERYLTPNDLCDIGAGEGTFLSELNKRGYRNIIGIEPNKNAIAFAKNNKLHIYEGTIVEAPKIIKDNNLRVVTLFHVIEHLKSPREALTNIYASLPTGGYLVIETPNANAYSFVRVNYKHPLIYPAHLFYFDTKNLPRLLEGVGFKVKARGKRGFDQYNMSIRHSLFCLGIGKPTFGGTQKGSLGEAVFFVEGNNKDSIIRTLLRKTLCVIVVLLGRVDYQWVIAEK